MFKKVVVVTIVLASLGFMAFTTLRTVSEIEEPKNEVAADGTFEPVIVLELYTSQGCSSCPPADVLLDKVKKEYDDEVFALSYHVDYWNYIGWKDPYSRSSYTQKQREYNIKFRNRSNYTPQVVVNGREHFVGSSSSKMYANIDSYKRKKSINKIEISNIKSEKRSLGFNYKISGDIKGRKLRAVLVLDERTTQVKRGENRNRTLINSNIVVAEKDISVAGESGSSYIGIPEIVGADEKIQLMLIVENDNYDITGAAKSYVSR
ncbi:MAG: DUF1223 domain-containing protein [Bacteroidota bacterium]